MLLTVTEFLPIIIMVTRVDKFSEDEEVKKKNDDKDKYLEGKVHFIEQMDRENTSRRGGGGGVRGLGRDTRPCSVAESNLWEKQGVANKRKGNRKVKENTDQVNEQMIIWVLATMSVQMMTEA
ncbi:hypothetical protein Cadr_000008256 [Camelus dromedarius]|uniref:Uncharacterized protein n=1 Tax=Camelus dromedarius TaxID=9838 RepID=A0A5N4DZB1_CAMDR|nr:hypothetical protein Cadr_000008256 [Camelus dromedarius]